MVDRSWPRVSVVVPSTGRPQLRDAVRSVEVQDYPGEVETVVVLDGGPPPEAVEDGLRRSGVSVVATGRRAGANAARNLGTRFSGGDLVAYLDDDDVWTPAKLSAQVQALEAAGHRLDHQQPERPPDRQGAAADETAAVVVSCRVRFRRAGGTRASRPVPDRLVGPGERVEDYLFRHRRPSLGRATIQTSTLLCPRELALQVPWDEQLTRHQDWDWITRAQDEAGATFVMVSEALVVCATGSSGSISGSPDWASSLGWARRRGSGWSGATTSDFLVGQTLRYALQARSLRGVGATGAAVARTGHPPSWQAAVVGLGGLLPRRAFETVVLTSGRRR